MQRWERRAISFLGLLILGSSAAAAAEPVHTAVKLDIRPEPIGDALNDFARQSGLQVVMDPKEGGNINTPRLAGVFTPEAALTQLLANTGLRFEYLNERTIAIVKIAPAAAAPGPDTPDTSSSTDPAKQAPTSSFGKRLSLAQQTPGSAQSTHTVGSSEESTSQNTSTVLQEIVVTAQKRAERLQDVPVPVTAISPQSLVDNNLPRLQDYYTSVPGLSVAPSIQSSQVLAIRGITTGSQAAGGSPTVGVMVDDVPYGASQNGGSAGLVVPDVDPGDLARIEVLRGPQGTLYGANSMGGLLKFVTVDPSTAGVSGRIEAGLDTVRNAIGAGYNVRGSVNLPLSDTLAIRASGFTRKALGYIDDPVTHVEGVNEQRVSGGRLSGLWQPNDVLSVKLSALYQRSSGAGASVVETGTGLRDLQQADLPGTGGFTRTTQAYSVTISASLGAVTLTSISGFNINEYRDSFDYTYALGDCCTLSQFGVRGTPVLNQDKNSKFTQELRLAGQIGSRFDWLLGGFFTHESSPFQQTILAADAATGQPVGTWVNAYFPVTYREYAAFADFTVHFTDQFDIQLGGRETQVEQSFASTFTGAYTEFFLQQPSPVVQPQADSKDSAFTYLVTPRLKLSPDVMVYARLASGFRPGGPNAGFQPLPEYGPDKTRNYEIGAKADLLDHRLSIDTSIYYIDWTQIQLGLIDPATGISYVANASQATSQGVELALNSRPLSGLTVSGWVDWSDAHLTVGFPSTSFVYGIPGNPLPGNARFSAYLAAEQEFPIANQVTGFAGGAVSYVGSRLDQFTATADRQMLPAYAKLDLHAGTRFEPWVVTLFANNVTDRRGLIAGGLGNIPPNGFYVIQPRTIGLTAYRTF